MLNDLSQFEGSSTIHCDLCIIGAGPAGISIAIQFANSNLSICLLESGGLRLDPAYQALCEGEVVGLPYWRPLHEVRYRYFGGSTSRWGAWLAPLNDIDFEFRPWIPFSGWPISKAELHDYYVRAHELCQAGSYAYADLNSVGLNQDVLQPFAAESLIHRIWQFGAPTRFGKLYRKILENSQNIQVMLYANVTELETNETATIVTGAKATTLEGKSATVRAKFFVLATGGLEAPRILLLSRRTQSFGLGNQNDLVGRFFMEHPHIDIGTAFLNQNRKWVRNYQMQRKGPCLVRPKLCFSEEKQRELELINFSCSIDLPDQQDTGYIALRRVKKTIMDPFENGSILRDIATSFINPTDTLYGIYCKAAGMRYVPHKAIPKEIFLRARVEQIPNPLSRVTLSEQRDNLGLNKIKLDWQLDGDEKRSMRLFCELLSGEFQRLGLGKIHQYEWLHSDNNEWPDSLIGGPHHMGTTRMSDDPKQGVVDRHCRVHSVENLYVAGSAVFPTGGYANPTLTIIALSLRLADHLQNVLIDFSPSKFFQNSNAANEKSLT